jgi:hypothetical protein
VLPCISHALVLTHLFVRTDATSLCASMIIDRCSEAAPLALFTYISHAFHSSGTQQYTEQFSANSRTVFTNSQAVWSCWVCKGLVAVLQHGDSVGLHAGDHRSLSEAESAGVLHLIRSRASVQQHLSQAQGAPWAEALSPHQECRQSRPAPVAQVL